jgi:YjjG family noncanonical pyrimidine nucleotidase
MRNKYSWLLFDADGTILDYRAAEAYSLKAAASFFGEDVNEKALKLYQEINSAFWAELEKGTITSLELRVRRFETLSARMGWDISAEEFSRVYLHELGQSGFMMPGAAQMLKGLPGGIKKAIITNGIKDTQYGRLKKASLMGTFDEIIISEEAGVAKPAAGFFDYTLERIGSRDKDDMLIIGDSLSSDIAGGAGYGIDTCWFNPEGLENGSELEPTYEIADWDGLFRIL